MTIPTALAKKSGGEGELKTVQGETLGVIAKRKVPAADVPYLFERIVSFVH